MLPQLLLSLCYMPLCYISVMLRFQFLTVNINEIIESICLC